MPKYLDKDGLEEFFDDIKDLVHGPSYSQISNWMDAHSDILSSAIATDVADATNNWLDEHPEATTSVLNGSITADKLANNSITSEKIVDGTITTNDLANGAITSVKIANGTIVTNNLADGSVTTTKIANNAVTANKLASNAIPTMSTTTAGIAKVGAGLTMNNGAVELDADTTGISNAVNAWLDAHPEATTTVQDGSVTNAKIANDTITNSKLDPNGLLNAMSAFKVLYDNNVDIIPNFELGYYSSSATWINNNTYVANKSLLSFPSGIDLYAECEIDDVYPFISEFKYENNVLVRKRVASSSNNGPQNTKLECTQDGCLYSFGLRNAHSSFDTIPYEDFVFMADSKMIKYLSDEIKSIYSLSGNGRTDIVLPLEHGYYYQDGTWKDSPTHLSPHELYKPKSESVLFAETSISGVTPYIKEFIYDPDNNTYSRVRNISGNPAIIQDADPNKFYSFDLFGDEITPIPTDNFDFYSKPLYMYNTENIINTTKNKVDDIINLKKIYYNYSSANSILLLTCDKMRYTIQRITDASKNLDSWRLYKGEIRIDGTWETMWSGTDAEGPIRLVGQSDFISGYHGDEVLQSAAIYIDNLPLDLAANASGECTTLALYQESTCYNDTLSVPAFTRYKKVEFRDGGDFAVQQRWVSLQECTVMRGAMALLQCLRANTMGWDTDRLLPLQPTSTGGSAEESVYLDAETTTGTIYLRDGTSLTIVVEQGQEATGYTPRMTYFNNQGRIKFYFDMYNGQELGIGDELISRFAVRVDRGV